MPLFPTFLDLSKRKILLLGGGEVASRKLEKLLMFSPAHLKIVAKEANDEFKGICSNANYKYEHREFQWDDLNQVDMVIVAIDDIPLQGKIFSYCEERNLLCNSVDSVDYCNFIFPALVTRGDLCVGINTAGKAPYLSKKIRKKLDILLPDELGAIVEKSHEFRSSVEDKKAMESEIKKYIDNLVSEIVWE